MKDIMKIRCIAAIGCTLCALGASSARALEGPGSTGAGYLELPTGPVSAAMGAAGVALRGDPFSWISNPALLGDARGFGVGVSHAEWILDTRLDHAVLHRRLSGLLVLGGAVVYQYRPDIQGYDDFGAPTEMLKNNSYQAVVALAVTPLPGLAAGVSVKYFRETLAEWSAGGPAADVGVFYAWPAPSISIGISAQNLGPDIRFDEVDEPLPTTIRGGTSVAFAVVPAIAEMRAAVDLVKPRFDNPYVSFGAELTLSAMLSIRAGWCGQEYREGNGFTMGGGVKLIERLQLDYAYAPYGDLGNSHRIAVHFSLP